MKPLRHLMRATARLAAMRLMGRSPPRVLISAMPKSASSFLTSAIGALPGMSQCTISYAKGRREQDIDLARLAQRAHLPFVAQHHVRYSVPTARLLDAFGVTTVVLVRDLFDVVASLRDHVRRDTPVTPVAYLTPRHATLPDAELELAIADLALPWYFSFYISWHARKDVLWLDFEDVRARPEASVARIAERAGIAADGDRIAAAVASARDTMPRFNKGVPGRGASLSAAAHARIEALAAHYPEFDLAPLGLSRAKGAERVEAIGPR